MHGFWPIFFLLVVLKVPVFSALGLVWWASQPDARARGQRRRTPTAASGASAPAEGSAAARAAGRTAAVRNDPSLPAHPAGGRGWSGRRRCRPTPRAHLAGKPAATGPAQAPDLRLEIEWHLRVAIALRRHSATTSAAELVSEADAAGDRGFDERVGGSAGPPWWRSSSRSRALSIRIRYPATPPLLSSAPPVARSRGPTHLACAWSTSPPSELASAFASTPKSVARPKQRNPDQHDHSDQEGELDDLSDHPTSVGRRFGRIGPIDS